MGRFHGDFSLGGELKEIWEFRGWDRQLNCLDEDNARLECLRVFGN